MKKNKSTNIDTQAAIDLFQSGEYEAAIKALLDIISLNTKNPLAWFLLATAYSQQGDYDNAENGFQNAISLQKIYPEAYNNLGVILESKNMIDDAEECYQTAIKQNGKYPNALYNLGHIHQIRENTEKAIELYLLALNYNPTYVKALNNLALMYQIKGNYKKARQYFKKALSISPNDPELINNMGFIHYYFHEYKDALECFQLALKLQPKFPAVFNNIGMLLRATGDLDAARQYFEKAAEDKNYFSQAMNNIAHLELGRENLDDGWHYYQYRQSNRNQLAEDVNLKDVRHKSILLKKDQGLGDELFFLRFAKYLENPDTQLFYLTDDKLRDVLSRNLGNYKIITSQSAHQNFDMTVSVAELPRLLNLIDSRETPAPVKLAPMGAHIETINNLLPRNDLKNIAISWQAGVHGKNTLFKRIEPEVLGTMLKNIDANILIIQRNPTANDIKALEKSMGKKAFNYSFINDSLEDVLAMLDTIDSYIGVSNTNMHLMAGLNKKAHVMIPHPPEWRWLCQGNTSPWFPHFKLFRQEISGSWEDALTQCSIDLKHSLNV